jgi:chitinase
MDLLWRNDIDPHNVTMDLAFYGRSFTFESPACTEPGCTYRPASNSGVCSETIEFLVDSDIQTS